MRVVACHQPNFMPWLGYFAKIARCDTFVMLDNVQFTRGNNKHNWTTRVRVLGSNGPIWISMPVLRAGAGEQKILDLRTDSANGTWHPKMIRTLEQAYGKTPFFEKVTPPIFDVLNRHRGSICVTNIGLIEAICGMLGLQTRRVKSSALSAQTCSTDRLIELVGLEGGNVYLSGDGAAGYQEADKFNAAGIGLRKLNFHHPVYRQRAGVDFVPGLSVLDALCFAGIEQTSDYVRNA